MKREGIENAGVVLYWQNDIEQAGAEYAYDIIKTIARLKAAPSSNAFKTLKEWRNLGDKMIRYIEAVNSYVNTSAELFDRMATDSEKKRYQRWSNEEDEILIELVTSGRPMTEVSACMGRTVPAINTRVSKLVGLKRLEAKIAGQFIGTLNGEAISGHVEGRLRKETLE